MIIAIDPGPTESAYVNAQNEKTARRKAQLKAANDRYREANRERRNAEQRQRRASNLAKQAERMRIYRAKRPDVIGAIEKRRVRPQDYKQKASAGRKVWAKRNPDKLREYAHKRSGIRLARLPSGTIKKIGTLQKWKCATCCCALNGKYHKDHIVPLAGGGKHEPLNIQLLCPTCNLKKGAKNPVKFMQERGLLL